MLLITLRHEALLVKHSLYQPQFNHFLSIPDTVEWYNMPYRVSPPPPKKKKKENMSPWISVSLLVRLLCADELAYNIYMCLSGV